MVKVSVVIPTFNRPTRLASCLESLARQDYPSKYYEVIVVDDGGQNELEPVIRPFQNNCSIKLIRQVNSGPAGARNTGVNNSVGEFIALVDDDCTLPEDWLSQLTPHLQHDRSRMYGGLTVNVLQDNIYSVASQSLIDYLYEYYNADTHNARFLASNNMIISREKYHSVGGFDTSFPGACGEDREFCDRWLHLGHQISFVSDVRVFHHHDLTLRTFYQQHFNYGTGARQFWESKASRGQESMKTEPLSFYINLVTFAWRKKLHRPLSLSLLIMLSQFANVAGFVKAKFANK